MTKKTKKWGKQGSADAVKVKVTGYEWIRVFKYIDHKFLFYFSTLICFVTDLVEPMISITEGKLADILISNDYSSAEAFEKDLNRISNETLYILLFFFFLNSIYNAIDGILLPDMLSSVKKALVKAVFRQNLGFFDATESGVLDARLTVDAKIACRSYTSKIVNIVRYSVQMIIGLVVMFIKSQELALYMSLYLPIFLLVNIYGTKKLDKLWKKFNNLDTGISAETEEVLSSIRTVKSFGSEMNEYQHLKQNLKDEEKYLNENYKVSAIKDLFMTFADLSSKVLIMYVGGKQAALKKTAPGTIIAFLKIQKSWEKAASSVISKLADYSKYNVSAMKVLDILERKPEIEIDKGITINNVKGNIEFRDVVFSYPTRDKVVLDHLSFTINSGETVAIVGESGCGKSTILQIIERFYDCQGGEVLLDGVDIKNISPSSLRNYIGYVPQTPVMFSMNIKNNIRFGKPEAVKEEIIDAAKISNAHDFILQQNRAYDTQVTQNSLSGGQKQRLCIARAVILKAPIMILDEATASLDSESENLIQKSIKELKNGRTMIIVAHRLSTIKNADKILVLSNGKLVEEGTHEELVAKGGAYANLVKSQLQ